MTSCGCGRLSGRHNYVEGRCIAPQKPVNAPLTGVQTMTGVPPQVLAERVAGSLRRAVTYNDARDCEQTRKCLGEAKEWLDKLREAMR